LNYPAPRIVQKNAIMMIDLPRGGAQGRKKPLDAIIRHGLLRFRPILMTTMAAMLGGLPLLWVPARRGIAPSVGNRIVAV